MSDAAPTFAALVPIAPYEDDALLDFLQPIIAGITCIGRHLVRPRWQAEPPNLPQFGTNWCAFGVTVEEADTFAYVGHDPRGLGQDVMLRHETFSMETSFYGPNSESKANLLRDGLQIAQNRELLQLNGMGVVKANEPIRAPVLIKERFLNRTDLTVTIRREIRRVYPIYNILQAAAEIIGGPVTLNVIVSDER